MTDFAAMADDYVRTRRALGYKFEARGRMLGQFAAYLHAQGADRLTVEHAVAWARLPADADPVYWSERLSAVRGFARYLAAFDPATEVPPTSLLARGSRGRLTPYLFSDRDVRALLDTTATRLRTSRHLSPLRVDTYQTLISLLAVTGMRIGETVGLDQADIDWDHGLITIRNAKFGKSRQIPVHDSTINALHQHVRRRDALLATRDRRPGAGLFVTTTGTRIHPGRASAMVGSLIRDTGLWNTRTGRQARAHDLRHSFAVRTLLGWYRAGVDVNQHLPLLSTYLGHTKPASTYWYLHAAPELMAIAAQRLDDHREAQP